jgi:hypothetical protein
MSFVPWPYVKTEEGWTIPIQVMLAVWQRMVELDRVKATFYGGQIKTDEDFITLMQSDSIVPILVVESEKPKLRALAWLSNIKNGAAYAHFCYLDRYQQAIGDLVIGEWSKLDSLKVIIGITPESYYLALKIIERWGFQLVGKIPEICNLHYENRREGGMISYYLTEGGNNGR